MRAFSCVCCKSQNNRVTRFKLFREVCLGRPASSRERLTNAGSGWDLDEGSRASFLLTVGRIHHQHRRGRNVRRAACPLPTFSAGSLCPSGQWQTCFAILFVLPFRLSVPSPKRKSKCWRHAHWFRNCRALMKSQLRVRVMDDIKADSLRWDGSATPALLSTTSDASDRR